MFTCGAGLGKAFPEARRRPRPDKVKPWPPNRPLKKSKGLAPSGATWSWAVAELALPVPWQSSDHRRGAQQVKREASSGQTAARVRSQGPGSLQAPKSRAKTTGRSNPPDRSRSAPGHQQRPHPGMSQARRSSEADRAERQLTGGAAFQAGNSLTTSMTLQTGKPLASSEAGGSSAA
jgi:hypothetical protein